MPKFSSSQNKKQKKARPPLYSRNIHLNPQRSQIIGFKRLKKLTELKPETWKKFGRVWVKRDKSGRIQQWLTNQEYEEIKTIRRLNASSVIIHPLKDFPRRNENQRKNPFRRKNSKKTKITIKLSTDLVNLLNFLRGRKSLGTLIEELIRDSLKQYQTLE